MTSASVSEAALTMPAAASPVTTCATAVRLAESSRLRFKPFRDLPLLAGQLLYDAPCLAAAENGMAGKVLERMKHRQARAVSSRESHAGSQRDRGGERRIDRSDDRADVATRPSFESGSL